MDVFVALGYLVLFYIAYKLVLKLRSIPQLGNLESRYVLITGCDTGFGNAAAKRWDGMGYNVIAACLTEDGQTELKKSCSNRMKVIKLDVSEHESVLKAYEEVKHILSDKGLWGLVNNAGIVGNTGPIDWLQADDYRTTLGVNLFGMIDMTMTFLPLIKQAKGRIINTASIAGRIAGTSGPYSVSKFGVEAFSDFLRRDLKVFGVTTHIIEPEFFKTDIVNINKLEAGFRRTYNGISESLKVDYGEEYLEESIEHMKEGMTKMPVIDTTPVIDAYTQALTASYPSARYLVGKRCWMWLTIQALPEWLGDRILAFLFKNKPIPDACKSLSN